MKYVLRQLLSLLNKTLNLITFNKYQDILINRKLMRKIIYIAVGVLIAVIIVAAVAGLYLTNNTGTSPSSKLKVIATFYPLYDFAQNVGGNKVTSQYLFQKPLMYTILNQHHQT